MITRAGDRCARRGGAYTLYIYTQEGDGYPAPPRGCAHRPGFRPGLSSGAPTGRIRVPTKSPIRAVGPFVGAYRIRPSPYPVAESFAPIGAFGGRFLGRANDESPLRGPRWGGFNCQLSMVTRVPVPHAGTRINNSTNQQFNPRGGAPGYRPAALQAARTRVPGSTIQRINNSTPGLPPGLSSGGPTGRAHPGTRPPCGYPDQQFNNSTTQP